MRILLDTNILARAATGPPGLANELVLSVTDPRHTLLLSPFLVAELRRVLRYERLRTLHGMDELGIEQYVADLETIAELIPLPDELPMGVTPDPDNDPVVATAIVGQANILCTKDRHLHRADVTAFCQRHGVQIMDDRELLVRLRARSS